MLKKKYLKSFGKRMVTEKKKRTAKYDIHKEPDYVTKFLKVRFQKWDTEEIKYIG